MRRQACSFLIFLLLAAPAFSIGSQNNIDLLLQQLKTYIAQQLNMPEADLSIKLLKTYPSPLGKGYELLPMSSIPKRGGISTFPLDRDGKRGYLTVEFQIYYPVVVATQSIKTHEALLGNVGIEKRDARFLPWDACRSLQETQNKESRFDLPKGEVLVPRDFTDLQLIHYGDLCSILVEKGSVEIHAQGEALAGGAAGSLIPVRLPETNRTIYAKVLKRGEVELDVP